MAIYHLSMKPVSRAKGRSSTASAAYRAGERIHDLRTGEVWDFSRRRGVEHTEIVTPTAAGENSWALDRQALWNAAEVAEVRKDARTAREYELALPHEFTREQQVDLVRKFSRELAERYGVAVDFAIHLPHWHGDQRNVHAHVMATTRQVWHEGLEEKASPEWSDSARFKKGMGSTKQELTEVRKYWAEIQNEKFLDLGLEVRVDHRTLKEQGIEREPTTHLGPAVSAMHRQGMDTRVAERIREQQRLAAELRIQRLEQIRALERDRVEVDKSIRDVSQDLAVAQRDRVEHRPSLNLDDIRRHAREEWLALRAERLAQEQSGASKLDKGAEKVRNPEQELSLDERQQRAAERWLEYRRTQEAGRGNDADKAHQPEREEPRPKPQELDRDYGQDDDFSM
jgi:hypothetical protein